MSWTVGQTVEAQWEDRHYYKAVIIEQTATGYKVNYPEYGETTEVLPSQIQSLGTEEKAETKEKPTAESGGTVPPRLASRIQKAQEVASRLQESTPVDTGGDDYLATSPMTPPSALSPLSSSSPKKKGPPPPVPTKTAADIALATTPVEDGPKGKKVGFIHDPTTIPISSSPTTTTIPAPPPPPKKSAMKPSTPSSTIHTTPAPEEKHAVEDLNGVWQADHSSPTCKLCHKEFSAILRRHHCRRCGHLVCSRCSPNKGYGTNLIGQPEKIAHEQGKKVRLCNACYEEQQKHTHHT